jgi:hypothetical protein
MLDPLAVADLFEDQRFLVLPVVRDQLDDRFPDHFVSRITENSFGALVPARHDAVESFTDDGVFRRFDDRGEPCRFGRNILVGFGFLFFPLFFHCDLIASLGFGRSVTA